MKKFTLLICLFIGNIAIAQITVGPGVVNRYYKVTGISGTSVNVGTSQGASHTLSAGDKVILMQMTGSTNNNAGKFEFADVVSVSGSSVQLSKIDRNYSVSSNVQLVWVPSNPSGIVVNGTIKARPYNGGLGGVVSVFTHGTLTLNGNISANHAGFRYGQTTISGKVYHGGGGGGPHGGGGGGGAGYTMGGDGTGGADNVGYWGEFLDNGGEGHVHGYGDTDGGDGGYQSNVDDFNGKYYKVAGGGGGGSRFVGGGGGGRSGDPSGGGESGSNGGYGGYGIFKGYGGNGGRYYHSFIHKLSVL